MNFQDLTIEEIFLTEATTWKDKVAKYEKIIETIKASSEAEYFDNNVSNFSEIIVDSNSNASEKAFELILAYVSCTENGSKNLITIISDILKSIRLTKLSTRKILSEILVTLSDKYSNETIETIVQTLTDTSTKPFVVNACLEASLDIVKKKSAIKYKYYAKAIMSLLGARDKGIRDLAKSVIIEIGINYDRKILEPFLKEIKPILVQEINEEINSRLPIQENNNEVNENEQEIIKEDIVEEVIVQENQSEENESIDLLTILNPEFYAKLSSLVREERKNAIEYLENLTNGKIFSLGNYRNLVTLICTIISTDTQIASLISACKVLSNLANGLGGNFCSYSSISIPICLMKFKYKKTQVTTALNSCLDSLFMYCSIDDLIPKLTPILDDKNSTIKSHTLLTLDRVLQSNEYLCIELRKHARKFSPIIRKLCDDSDSEVRESSFKMMAILIAITNYTYINKSIDKLDSVKSNRIDSYVNKLNFNLDKFNPDDYKLKKVLPATTKTKFVKFPIAAKSKFGGSASSKNNFGGSTSSLLGSKSGLDRSNISTVSRKYTKKTVLTYLHCIELISDIMKINMDRELNHNTWSNRLKAVEHAQKFINNNNFNTDLTEEFYIAILDSKHGLQDKNISVLKSKFELLIQLLDYMKPGQLPKCNVDKTVSDVLCHLSDNKLSDVANALLDKIFEKCADINKLILSVLQNASNCLIIKCTPAILSTLCNLIENHNNRSQRKSLTFRDVIKPIRTLLENNNHKIRVNTVQFIGVFYQYYDKRIATQFSDLPSVISNGIEKEIAYIEKNKKTHPKDDIIYEEERNEEHNCSSDQFQINLDGLDCAKLQIIPEAQSSMIDQSGHGSTIIDETRFKCRDEVLHLFMDLRSKITHGFECYSNDFIEDINDFLQSNKNDKSMKSSLDILLNSLKQHFILTSSVEIQTDKSEDTTHEHYKLEQSQITIEASQSSSQPLKDTSANSNARQRFFQVNKIESVQSQSQPSTNYTSKYNVLQENNLILSSAISTITSEFKKNEDKVILHIDDSEKENINLRINEVRLMQDEVDNENIIASDNNDDRESENNYIERNNNYDADDSHDEDIIFNNKVDIEDLREAMETQIRLLEESADQNDEATHHITKLRGLMHRNSKQDQGIIARYVEKIINVTVFALINKTRNLSTAQWYVYINEISELFGIFNCIINSEILCRRITCDSLTKMLRFLVEFSKEHAFVNNGTIVNLQKNITTLYCYIVDNCDRTKVIIAIFKLALMYTLENSGNDVCFNYIYKTAVSLVRESGRDAEYLSVRVDLRLIFISLGEYFRDYYSTAIVNTNIFRLFKTFVNTSVKKFDRSVDFFLPTDEDSQNLRNYVERCYSRNQL